MTIVEGKELFQKYQDIYVYGYSNWGRNIFNKIKVLYPDKVKGIIDKNKNLKRLGILDLEQISFRKQTLVLVEFSPFMQEEIKDRLQENGLKNVLIYSNEIDDYINNSLLELPKLEIRLLAICVGQACNLKCKNCANFAPYARKDNMRYKIENIKSDLEKILSCFSKIDTFHIQGGEPLLYSDLEELLACLKTNYCHIIKNIQIATNGTIVPSEKILEVIKRIDALVRISNYPIETKADELIALLKERDIRYRVYNFASRTGEWSDAGAMDYTIPKEKDVVRQVYECGWNTCFTIENGLVGRCARSIPALTLQNVPMREKDYIDLKKDLDMKKVHRFFTITSPMACCMHCKGTTGEPIKPAIQI